MAFPELIFGNQTVYLRTQTQIGNFFLQHKEQLMEICRRATQIKATYICLEHFFHDFTGPICGKCLEPCCVNRHGFPDFEDLIVFRAMGIKPPGFNCNCIDTEPCQFLGPGGCILPRYRRSYRCTWYFCDYCMDEFKKGHWREFKKFQDQMARLSHNRIYLLRLFEKEWEQAAQQIDMKPELVKH